MAISLSSKMTGKANAMSQCKLKTFGQVRDAAVSMTGKGAEQARFSHLRWINKSWFKLNMKLQGSKERCKLR